MSIVFTKLFLSDHLHEVTLSGKRGTKGHKKEGNTVGLKVIASYVFDIFHVANEFAWKKNRAEVYDIFEGIV